MKRITAALGCLLLASLASAQVTNKTTTTEYPTIDSALTAVTAGDTLEVDSGVYTEALNVPATITILGAAGTRPVIQWDGDTTNLNSLPSWAGGSCFLTAAYGSRPVLQNLEITGRVDTGTVVKNLIYTPTFFLIENCVLHGAAGYLARSNSELKVTGSVLYDANNGVQCKTNITVRGNEFYDLNTALYNYHTRAAVFTANRIHGCSRAIYSRDTRDNVYQNNLIYHNTAVYSPYSTSSFDPSVDPTFLNNTIVYNRQNGLTLGGSLGAIVKNNIIYGNGTADTSAYVDIAIKSGGSIKPGREITHNLIGTVDASMTTTLTDPAAEGNIAGIAPNFADTTAGDFHLGIFSAGIDDGDGLAGDTDYDGGHTDMGAYGGPEAMDTLMPRAINGLAIVQEGTTDTLSWTESVDDDFALYVIIRLNVDSGFTGWGSGAAELVDTIRTRATVTAIADNGGSKWVYAINALDSSLYAGGYDWAFSSNTPEIVVAPRGVDFGLVDKDSFALEMVAAVNAGTDTLTITGVSLLSGADFTVVDTAGSTITAPVQVLPDEGYGIVVIVNPTAYGIFADTLVITSSDADPSDSLILVPLKAATAEPSIHLTDLSIDFGTVDVDSTSSRTYLDINSNGTAALVLDTMYYADGTDFYYSNNITFPYTIGVLGRLRLAMYARPLTAGDKADTLFISCNDPVDSLVPINVSVTVPTVGMTDRPLPLNGYHVAVSPNPVHQEQYSVLFRLGRQRRVGIAVYNASGQMVRQVAPKAYSRGSHQVRLTGQLKAGSYFVVLKGPGLLRTRQLIVTD